MIPAPEESQPREKKRRRRKSTGSGKSFRHKVKWAARSAGWVGLYAAIILLFCALTWLLLDLLGHPPAPE
jgi:hypothetical protein